MTKTGLAGVMIAAMCAAGVANAQQTDGSTAASRGEAHYLFSCANCHGADADGHGPYAHLLKMAPSNLTVLQKGSNENISDRILKAVNGRHKVGEGASKAMPVFSEDLTVNVVYEIIEYLKTVQK